MTYKIAFIIYQAYKKEYTEAKDAGRVSDALMLQHHAAAWLTVAEELQTLEHAGLKP